MTKILESFYYGNDKSLSHSMSLCLAHFESETTQDLL